MELVSFIGINLDDKTQSICKKVAEKNDLSFGHGAGRLPEGKISLLIPLECIHMLPQMRAQSKNIEKVAVIHSGDFTEAVRAMCQNEQVVSIIGRNTETPDIFETDLEFFMRSGNKNKTRSIGDSLDAVDERSVSVKSSNNRTGNVDELVKRIGENRNNSATCAKVISLSDELLMNAIYDSSSKHACKKRTHEVSLESQKAVELDWKLGKETVAIAVKDLNGSVERSKILSALLRCYECDNKINFITAGSGLGCYLITKISPSFAVSVIGEKETTCSVLYPLTARQPLIRKINTSFHLDIV